MTARQAKGTPPPVRIGPLLINVIASDALSPNEFILISGEPSDGGRAEIKHRVDAGEDGAAVLAEVLVRERKATKGRFTP